MSKKRQITTIDIVRWIAILPISVIVLLGYSAISSWINKAYLLYLRGNDESYFTSYIDSFTIPIIIVLCGYFISPLFKFRSTLFLIIFYMLVTIYKLLTDKYVSNPFLILYLLTTILSLYVIYRIEEKND